MSARIIIGWGLISTSFVFLAINSNILARGAARWAEDSWDKTSYGIIAALVPWIIAITPFVILWAWRSKHRIWSLVGSAVYLLFIAYNLLGAGGAIAVVRNEAISTRVYGAKIEKRSEDLREALAARRDAIAKTTRPAKAIAPMIEAEKARPFWERTSQCTAPETRKERDFCAGYYKLATELGSAQELEQITERIAEIDVRSIERGPVAIQADPQTRFIVRWTGLAEEAVGEMIPLATPVVLEAGSMTLMAFGILLLGFNHGSLSGHLSPRVPDAVGGLAAIPQQTLPPPPRPVQTQFVADWFAEHARPVTQGSLPEEQWYALYCGVCAQSGIVPVPIDTFRGVAERHGAKITHVDGKHFYQRILPRIAA